MAGSISVKYKELQCYKFMSSEDQKSFDELAKHYGSILNAGSRQSVTVYTAHDFDHHCFDLYRNISLFILNVHGLNELTKEELYLLNLSVLLHDISMCKGGYENGSFTYFNRKIHSLQSAQWIRQEFSNSGSRLHEVGLTKKQIEIICAICKAHSDLKDQGKPSGLFDPDLKDIESGMQGNVRTKALAGILRIADELDVTSQRLAGCDAETALIQQPDDKRNVAQTFNEENQESIKHFNRLKLISDLELSPKNVEEIILVIDEIEVKRRLELGDEANLGDDLKEVQKKLQKELIDMWDEALCKPKADAAHLTALKRVVWSDNDTKWVERFNLDDGTKPVTLPLVEDIKDVSPDSEKDGERKSLEWYGGETNSIKKHDSKRATVILDSGLSKDIKELVINENLLSVGHYQLNSIYCARDWIDTKELLNCSSLSDPIIHIFYNHMKDTFCKERYTIVGLDLVGAITAAQIGFMLQKPFTYVIPAHQYSQADAHEVYVPGIPEEHKIILVTDSIVTGHTVSQIIRENKWEKQILAIYTIFYREPKITQNVDSILPQWTVYALNADFSAEIAKVSNCPFGTYPENCHAKNKKM
jgi:hypothetical protein